MRRTYLILLALIPAIGLAQTNGRPDDLSIADFQFGPQNRWAFSHIREVLTTANIPNDPAQKLALPRSDDYNAELTVEFQGRRQSIAEIAQQQYIDGILIIKGGKVLHEAYFGELRPELPHLMMSQSKSVIGMLAGVFEAKGLIDLDKTVGSYVPALVDSGWGPDSLRLLLDMKDGAAYTEEYEDFSSTVRLQDCALGWGTGEHCPENGPRGGYEFFANVGRNEENLGRFVYKSGSTDVMGWVLEEVGGAPLAELISTHIWKPMGAEFDAFITVDDAGFALGDGGMNSTLRDMGRFGLLMLNHGNAMGKEVVPAAYVEDILHQPGDPDWPYAVEGSPDKPFYRSFWWGSGNDEGDVSASGIHGQYLSVAPEADMTIAIFSTWPRASGGQAGLGWPHIMTLASSLVKELRD
jgi:CubicO group peptidase (beta-lactamase class C family)